MPLEGRPAVGVGAAIRWPPGGNDGRGRVALKMERGPLGTERPGKHERIPREPNPSALSRNYPPPTHTHVHASWKS